MNPFAALILRSLFIFLAAPTVFAETIEIDEEELATESVLPVFAKKVVVRQRNVTMSERFELAGGGGLNLVEPLYTQMTFNFIGTYMFDEINGMNLMGYKLSNELSSAAKDLKNGEGLQSGNEFDASTAPTAEYIFIGNYVFNAYYGKVSITKQTTMNLMLYGLLGAGIVKWTDSTSFALDVGMGQKFYFTPRFSLRFDLVLMAYQGPDPTSETLPKDGPDKSSDAFDEIIYYRPFLTGGASFLF